MTTDLATQDTSQHNIAVANREDAAAALAHILGTGDLGRLSNEQRVATYLDVCQSLGLNPRTRPFDWIEFYDPETKAKKLTLYANQSCASQLRRQHQISIRKVRAEPIGAGTDEAMFVVELEGTTPTGRVGSATKYVPLTYMDRQQNRRVRLSGERLANAYMKAETGALRRLTFSMVGMASPPDIDELSRARVVVVDGTGRVLDHPTQEQKALAENPALARVIGEPIYEDAAADDAPLAGTADQRVRPGELERPARPDGPRPTFRPSEEDIKRWRETWFATVKGLSLDTEDARHAFVAQWTADEWPKAKRTDSLRTMFARCTAAEAGEFLAHVRALMDDERREMLNWADDAPPARDQEPARRHPDQRVHDAVMLTGGPSQPGDAGFATELDPDGDDDTETAF